MLKKLGLCMSIVTLSMMGFIRIGHRGACGYAPENTLASFEKAIEMGVDMIELDVFRCRSGELVVIHDDTVDRTTNGHGYVEEKTLAQLQQLNAGDGQQIPTLAQVFDLVDRRVIINIELKGNNTALLTADLIHLYVREKGWGYEDFFVSSFNLNELRLFKQRAPQVQAVCAIFDKDQALETFFAHDYMNYFAIAVSQHLVNQEHVAQAHARGLKIYVYTVNDSDEIARIKALCVDGIFSNFPDRL